MQYVSIFRPGLFSGQTIIVSGGGSGIGRTIAHELASLGAHVVLVGRKREKLDLVQGEIVVAGGQASAHVCNIREEAQVVALFEAISTSGKGLFGLVNNVGGQFLSLAEDISGQGWQAVVETNLTGTFLMCQAAFKHFMKERGGVMVNIAAEMWRGFPGLAHAGAARAGVVNLTKTLAVEWASAGVRVNAVAPGLIRSSGLLHYGQAMQPLIEQMTKNLPAKRMGTESEVAAAVTFLLSPAAAYISGETLKVDGAGSLWRKEWEIDDHDNTPAFEGFIDD